MINAMSTTTGGWGRLTRIACEARQRGADTNLSVVVRFWIITMMLVLVGLSTLKLR
jgi:UDP-N-acetylmuramyl pentapeptide phosphotransferase/UDP-N-acetylglucosamine-1-phosphate transferase